MLRWYYNLSISSAPNYLWS